jgi:hypothetical protein
LIDIRTWLAEFIRLDFDLEPIGLSNDKPLAITTALLIIVLIIIITIIFFLIMMMVVRKSSLRWVQFNRSFVRVRAEPLELIRSFSPQTDLKMQPTTTQSRKQPN